MQVSGGTTTKTIGRMTLSRTLNDAVWENRWEYCDSETSLVFPRILRISDFQLITVDLLNSLTTTSKLQFGTLGNFLGLLCDLLTNFSTVSALGQNLRDLRDFSAIKTGPWPVTAELIEIVQYNRELWSNYHTRLPQIYTQSNTSPLHRTRAHLESVFNPPQDIFSVVRTRIVWHHDGWKPRMRYVASFRMLLKSPVHHHLSFCMEPPDLPRKRHSLVNW